MIFSKAQIIKNFSRYASSYDHYADIQQLAARHLLAELPAKEIHTILEVGCGTGCYTTLLRNKYPEAKITAIDISAKMIEYAKMKLSGEDIDFKVADAEEGKLEGKYNLITANAVFQWFEYPGKTIARYKNDLLENGLLAFSFFGPQTFYELHRALSIHFQQDIGFTSSSFIAKSDLAEIMQKHFVNFSIKELFLRKKCLSLLDLLTKIKYTGTNGFGIKEKIFWHKRLLHAIEEVYRKEFGGIETTSHIFICKGSL